VIEAVAAARPGPFPAKFVHGVRVQQTEGVPVAVGVEAAEQRKLGLVPALAAIGT